MSGIILRFRLKEKLILITLLWPSFLLIDSDIAKQATLLLYFLVLLLALHRNIKKVTVDLVEIFLILYFLYVLIITFMTFENIRDISDALRLFFILICYRLGKKIDIPSNEKQFIWLLSISIISLSSFILYFLFGLPNLNDSLYSDFGRRYFGTTNSPNYLWINLVIIYYICENITLNNLKKTLIYCVLLLSLILSGSRTSLIIITLFFLLIKFRKKSIVKIGIIALSLFLLFIQLKGFENFYFQRIEGLVYAIASFDISSIESFSNRLDMWDNSFSKISFIGTGPLKSTSPIYDNSFLTTLIRYGWIGLLIELAIFSVIMIKAPLNKKNKRFIIALTTVFLIAGIPSTIFYNLKAPYLFFLISGHLLYSGKNRMA